MRTKGNIQLGLNFEPTGASILDARLLVSTKSDLIAQETYADKNVYKGMLVTVQDTAELYLLIDPDKITEADYSGWKRLDAGAVELVDIVNDLTTGGADKALAAEQGKVLKSLIDQNKTAADNYTVNGKKVSTNPVLGGADINLSDAYQESTDSTTPAVGDSIDVAIGKLAKGVQQAEASGVTSLNGKTGDVTIGTGTINGSIKVGDADVPVKGLGSAAYQNTDAFEAAGSVDAAKAELIGSDDDTSTDDTIKGAKKYADEQAASSSNTLKSELIGTPSDTSDMDTIEAAKKYAEEKAEEAQTAASSDAQTKANAALTAAKAYTDQKDTAQTQALTAHIENTSNPHSVTKGQVGLGNVTNDAQVKRSEMGVANGVATLNENGKIPVSQLDGQIARVFGIEKAVANQAALPQKATEGERYYTIDTKKIYEKTAEGWDEGTTPKEDTIYNFRQSDATGSTSRTNILYRWDGANLVEISSSLALGESSGTAYEGSKGKQNANNIAALQSKVTEIDAYTVNGKIISENPVIGAGDIQTTSHGTVDSAINNLVSKDTELESSIAEGDANTLQSAKEYTNQQIATVTATGAKYYHTSVNEGQSTTITASTHGCGTFPSVTVYESGSEIEAEVSINATGDVTVSWNGAITKIDVVIVGK